MDCSLIALSTESIFENESDFDAVLVKVTFEYAFLQQRLFKDAFRRRILKSSKWFLLLDVTKRILLDCYY